MLTNRWWWLWTCISFFLLGAQTPTPVEPRITSPLPGSALQGAVTITAFTDVPDFQYAEVSFSYTGGGAESWFLIQQTRHPQPESPIAVWDTTTIADGDYRLRLQIFTTTGSRLETFVDGLRVRNYTPVETNTPVRITVQAAQATQPPQTATPVPLTATPRNTPTFLPPNPARIEPSNLATSLGLGIGTTVFIFFLILLYQAARNQGPPR